MLIMYQEHSLGKDLPFVGHVTLILATFAEFFCIFLHSFPSDKCIRICSSSFADNEELLLNLRFLSSLDRVLSLDCRTIRAEAAAQAGKSVFFATFTNDSDESLS